MYTPVAMWVIHQTQGVRLLVLLVYKHACIHSGHVGNTSDSGCTLAYPLALVTLELRLCVCVCVYASVCVCIYICMYCMLVYICICTYTSGSLELRLCVYASVCVYIYIYIYIIIVYIRICNYMYVLYARIHLYM